MNKSLSLTTFFFLYIRRNDFPLNLWLCFVYLKQKKRGYSLNKDMTKTFIFLFYYYLSTQKTFSF